MKKKALLFLLLIVLGVSLTYRFRHPYRQEKVKRLIYRGAPKRVAVSKKVTEDRELQKAPGIMLTLFSNPPIHGGEVIRNPFFQKRRKKKAKGPKRTVSKQIPERPRPAPEEDPRVRVRRDLARFRVFGSYKGEGKSMIFLQRGKDVLVVQSGDKIDGKYLVKRIAGLSLDLWAEDIQEDIHIDLSDF